MAVTPVQLNTLADVLPVVVKHLGIHDPNYPEGGTVAAGAPYTLTQVKKLIFQADYEIALQIVENLDHTYRTIFITEETNFLTDGALVPAHVGEHSRVTLKKGAQQFLGRFRDKSRMTRIKGNPAVYGNPKNLYSIFGGRIHFSDPTVTGKLDIPKVTKDTSLTTLISPLPYFWAVVAGAIVTAAMPGFPESHRRYWSNLWMKYQNMISAGASAIPEPEQLERLGA